MIGIFTARYKSAFDKETHMMTGRVYGEDFTDMMIGISEYLGDKNLIQVTLTSPAEGEGNGCIYIEGDVIVH